MSPLIVERRDQATHPTLKRPEKANALDAALVDALLAAVNPRVSRPFELMAGTESRS